jgi:hypothetical protein
MRWEAYVGQQFKAMGGLYECLEYDSNKGLRMRLLSESVDFPSPRVRGDETWVSERALGRTYYEVYDC